MEERATERTRAQWIGLVAGPLAACLCFALLPDQYVDAAGETVRFEHAGRVTLALMVWMGTWWLTEAIPVPATALLPVACFPLLGAVEIREAAAPYAHHLIFLFMGGFLLALSMQRWGLDRRFALTTLRVVGTRPPHLVGGFMIATAILSSFVSNTATTAMMLPIALSVIDLTEGRSPVDANDAHRSRGPNLSLCLMLGTAYAASIGGIATIIGTPTNALLVAYLDEQFGLDVGFGRWLLVGLPVSIALLPIAWFLLTRVLHPLPREPIEGGGDAIRGELRRLGPLGTGERVTLAVFSLTALLWMTRPFLQRYVTGISDAGIAVVAGLVLFMIPVDVKKGVFTMNWETAKKMPFGLLLLFGGGLSLAAAVADTGVAEFLGSRVASFHGAPSWVLVLVVTAVVVFLTELTSNVATAATLIPVLAAVAPALGTHPFLLIVPTALAASCAFMMPVATPPNAIVFSSGHVTIGQMCRAGLWLNIISIALITGLAFTVVMQVLGP